MATHGDYEHSDAKTGPLWIGALVLAVLMAGSMAISRWFDRGLTERLEREDVPHPVAELRAVPATPELQAVPAAELFVQRAEEQALLHSPASWIDPVNGIVRIPIDEAMQKVLAEGFPVRTEERR
jgi:hypothetical protein